MVKYFISVFLGIILGFGLGYYTIIFSPIHTYISNEARFLDTKISIESIQNTFNVIFLHKETYKKSKIVIGFLPYWLINTARKDYSKYITDLTYFGVAVGTDGAILTSTNAGENEPGWNALLSGKLNPYLQNAKKDNIKRSLVIFSGNQDAITTLMENPIPHAKQLVHEVEPLMKKYGFSDVNLDIEYTETASDAARTHFTQFVKTVKEDLNIKAKATVTVEISSIDVMGKHLIDVAAIGSIADHIVVMAYDYHSTDSYVTGPISPLYGAGSISEFDVSTAIEKTLEKVPAQKVILGVPLYGYEWETMGNVPRSVIIPNTGLVASNRRTELFISSCASCSANFEPIAGEPYLIYRDGETGTYHQIFYPDVRSSQEKIQFAQNLNLGGIALWALGYEGKFIINPFENYKRE